MRVTTVATRSLADLRAEVEQFYANHFQLLDSGRTEEWAATFTEDGAFYPPTLPEPVRGRSALAAGAAGAHAEFEKAGDQRRHWHGMVAVTQRPDDTIFVRCYALIFVTPAGGSPRLHLTCVCEDVFVRRDGELLVAERRVSRDDRP